MRCLMGFTLFDGCNFRKEKWEQPWERDRRVANTSGWQTDLKTLYLGAFVRRNNKTRRYTAQHVIAAAAALAVAVLRIYHIHGIRTNAFFIWPFLSILIPFVSNWFISWVVSHGVSNTNTHIQKENGRPVTSGNGHSVQWNHLALIFY